MKGLQRIISGMLALCLLISMLPVGAWAAEAETIPETTVLETEESTTEITEMEITVPTVTEDIPEATVAETVYEATESMVTETEPDETELMVTEPEATIAEEFATSASVTTIVASGACGENLTWTLNDSGVLTISGSGAMYDHFPGDDEHWLWDHASAEDVTSVVFEGEITYLGAGAFYGTSLTSITIPDSVTSMDISFIQGIDTLSKIWVEEGNPNFTNDDNGALYYKQMTGLIKVPNCVEGEYAIPMGCVYIDPEAFFSCPYLTKVTIPDGVEAIENGTFSGCTMLQEITIPDSVSAIGWSAFNECTSLETIFYTGTEESWEKITVESLNECLATATIIYVNNTAVAEGNFSNHKYEVYDLSLTWTEAKAYCEELGGHLVTITSAEEQAFIESLLPEPYTKRQYWLGATSESGSWQWVTGETFSYSNWDDAQPDGNVLNGKQEMYAQIHNYCGTNGAYTSERYTWNDTFIDNDDGSTVLFAPEYIGFVCEYDADSDVELNDHTYQLFDHCSTWDEAKAYCESLGGHLATITSEEENAFLYEYIVSQGVESAYFGLTDSTEEGTWVWCTGESVDYLNWHSGEPNGENSGEDYAMFYYKYEDGTWNDGDFDGSTLNGGDVFICEWDADTDKEPGELYTGGGYIRTFSKWDDEKKIAYFGTLDILGSQMTEETDTSFLANLNTLLNTEVLVETWKPDDQTVGSDILLGIYPLEICYGVVTSLDSKDVVAIDGVAYPYVIDGLFLPSEGDAAQYYLYENSLIACRVYSANASGCVTNWESETGVVTISGKTYHLSEYADDATRALLGTSGEKDLSVYFVAWDSTVFKLEPLETDDPTPELPSVEYEPKERDEAQGYLLDYWYEWQKVYEETFIPAVNRALSSLAEEEVELSKEEIITAHAQELKAKDDRSFSDYLIPVSSKKHLDIAYKALATYLYETTRNHVPNLSALDVSDTLVGAELVTEVLNNMTEEYMDLEIDGADVEIDIDDWFGNDLGTITVNRERYIVCATQEMCEESISDFLKELQTLSKNAIYAVADAVYEDILGKSLSSLTSEYINKAEKKLERKLKITLREKLKEMGAGNLLDTLGKCYSIYYNTQKVIDATSADSLEQLVNQVTNLELKDKDVTDAVVETAMKHLDKATDKVQRALQEYLEGTIVDKENSFWRILFGCPITISIYNSAGEQIGYISDEELWYTEDIEIVRRGEAKEIRVFTKEVPNFKITATDSGLMSCSIEECNSIYESVGCLNYYDISITQGEVFTLDLKENLNIISDSQTVHADEYIQPYETADITVSGSAQGGSITGTGTYARGSIVTLVAHPDNAYVFSGWYDGETYLGGHQYYQFMAKEDVSITAQFTPDDEIYINAYAETGGEILGGGTASRNETVNLRALPWEGYIFSGWYADGQLLSEEQSYAFIAAADCTILAEFEFDCVATGPCGDNLSWAIGSNGQLIISGTGAMYDFGFEESPWYKYTREIEEIILPDGLTYIGQNAFRGLYQVQHVSIPKGVTEISYCAFIMTGLRSVSLPEGLRTIEDSAFTHAPLRTVNIPDSVTRIGGRAFSGCALESVFIPASVTEIEGGAFSDCARLKSITVDFANVNFTADAQGVLYSKDMTVLYQCPGGFAGEYVIPEGVTTLECSSFFGCAELTKVTIPDSVVNMYGQSTFEHCTALTELILPDGIIEPAWGFAFGCERLETVKLPEQLEKLSINSFYGCTKLTRIIIPASVKEIECGCFINTGLSSIVFRGSFPTIEETIFNNTTETAFNGVVATAYYPGNDTTWTVEVMQDYGGTITWVPYYETENVTRIEAEKVVLEAGESIDLTAILDPGVLQAEEVIWTLYDEGNGGGTTLAGNGTAAVLTAGWYIYDNVITVTAQTTTSTADPAVLEIMIKERPADYTLFSGKSMTLKEIDYETGKYYSSKRLTWGTYDEYAPYVTLTSTGRLTAKKVVAKTRILIFGDIDGQPGFMRIVDILPSVTHVEVQDEEGIIVSGETVTVDFSDEETAFTATAYPLDTMQKVQWIISDAQKQAFAEYEINGDTMTVVKPKGKAGTVTVKAVVDAGQKKTVTFKLQFGSFAQNVVITAAASEIHSGGSLQLSAVTVPSAPTKAGITWSLSKDDKAYASISSSGLLKAKTVYDRTVITVLVTSKDGQAQAEYPVTILPSNESLLILRSDGKNVTMGTAYTDMNGDGTITLTAEYFDGSQPSVIWTVPKSVEVLAMTETSLTIRFLKAGTATIKATDTDGQKVTVKVIAAQMAQSVEISQKKTGITEGLEVASGKSLDLQAAVENAKNKKVTWSLAPGDEAYAKISSSGKLTANKDLTSMRQVTVTAMAADGSGISDDMIVTIRPIAQGVQLYSEAGGQMLFSFRTQSWWVRSNTTLVWDMSRQASSIALNSHVFPYYGEDDAMNAIQTVTWKSSSPKIANIVDGVLEIYKTGSTTITATAADGSGQKVSFELNVVKTVTELEIDDQTLQGGKSLNLAKLVTINPGDATNKKLNWEITYGSEYATISSSGTFKAKKVSTTQTVVVRVRSQDGGASRAIIVTITP